MPASAEYERSTPSVDPLNVGDTDGTFRATLKSVMTSEDGSVIGVHRNSGKRNGKDLDVDCCIAFEIADGQIVAGREFFYDLYAWDEFWS